MFADLLYVKGDEYLVAGFLCALKAVDDGSAAVIVAYCICTVSILDDEFCVHSGANVSRRSDERYLEDHLGGNSVAEGKSIALFYVLYEDMCGRQGLIAGVDYIAGVVVYNTASCIKSNVCLAGKQLGLGYVYTFVKNFNKLKQVRKFTSFFVKSANL